LREANLASPHVSAGVSLLTSDKSELNEDYEVGVKKALLDNAFQSALTGTGQSCGGVSYTQFRNHTFGN
jgi:hypothetical protein